ncbi:hypothetical protein Nmel_011169 [Mimus melanotis]
MVNDVGVRKRAVLRPETALDGAYDILKMNTPGWCVEVRNKEAEITFYEKILSKEFFSSVFPSEWITMNIL